jgi:Fe-S cluster assembly ATP-binding protein
MLSIENLTVAIQDRVILKNITLNIPRGETHILFGPNGSGKTTLLMAIMGFSGYQVQAGKILFKGKDITDLPTDERARLGIGISVQRPPTIKGVTTRTMVKISSNNGVDPGELAGDFNLISLLDRDINDGFSGGEIKRSELLQLMAQNPSLVLLDEPESGVDLENITLIGNAINRLLEKEVVCAPDDKPRKKHKEERDKIGLIITHTGFILNYVEADKGHVLMEGCLSCTGNPHEMLNTIKEFGYEECKRCK